MAETIEEIEHALCQGFDEFMMARIETLNADREASPDQFPAGLAADGFREPKLSGKMATAFNEYYDACIVPQLRVFQKAIFYAVAKEIHARGLEKGAS